MLETSAGQVEYRQSIFGKEVAAKICQHFKKQKIVEVILVKKQRGKSRATHVAGDMRKRRLQSLLRMCVALLLPTLYLFYCVSGLYIIDVELTKLKEQIVWCLLHPLKIYNDKSLSMVFVGGLLWMVLSFTAYSRSDHNRMPGNEFGSAKWGEVREFNEKYAAKTADG